MVSPLCARGRVLTESMLQEASIVAVLVSAVLAVNVPQLEAAIRRAEQMGLESLVEYSQAATALRGLRVRQVGPWFSSPW